MTRLTNDWRSLPDYEPEDALACHAKRDSERVRSWSCTLRTGHEGPHVAHAITSDGYRPMAAWLWLDGNEETKLY